VLNFRGLGWAFPVANLWEAALKHCGPRLLKLDVAKNDLDGNLGDLVRQLVVLEELDVSDNRRLKGTLEPLSALSALASLDLSGCKGTEVRGRYVSEGLAGTLETLSGLSAFAVVHWADN